jgi:hypothetical protein
MPFTAPKAPAPAPGRPREELPGQQLLPLETAGPLQPPTGRSQDPRGRPWSFGHLARVAGDLVRSEPDRTWDGNALCAALKEAGARVSSWRGLSFKLAAHLHKAGAIVLARGNRFRAALRPAEPSAGEAASGPPRRGKPPVRRQEPSWDDIVAAARRRLADVPTHVWTAAELTRALRQSGLGILQRDGVENRLAADLRAQGVIEYLDEQLFRARAPVKVPPDAAVSRPEAPVAGKPSSAGGRSEEPPWTFAKLIKAARSVVERQPEREWTGPAICQGLVEAGARLDSWRGAAMKITAELKRRGVIQAVTRVQFRVTRPASAAARAEPHASAKRTLPPAAGLPLKHRGSEPSEPPPAIPWDDIVVAAQRVLEVDPARVWKWSELAQATRASGVTSPTWKGVHIGLVAKLEVLGLVERVDAQRLRAIASATSSAASPAVDASGPTEPARPAETQFEEVTPASPPPAEAAPHATPTKDASAAAPLAAETVFALIDEIEKLEPWLGDLPQRQRTAQVAAWAGCVRRLQDGLGSLAPDACRREREALRPTLGGLARLARKHDCDWVDALSSAWAAEDWDAYVQYNHAVASGQPPILAPEKEEQYHRDRVRGLFNPHRRTARRDALEVIREALEVLAERDADVARAIRTFGRPQERRVAPLDPKPPFRRRQDAQERPEEPVIVRDVPADVLAITRGKRALVAGGQGSREAHRAAIEESLQFERLEWVFGERGKASHFSTLEGRVRPGRYDLVFFLASHSGHKSGSFIQACRTAGIPLIYLARGYGVNQVVDAIRQQLLARRVTEWMNKR